MLPRRYQWLLSMTDVRGAEDQSWREYSLDDDDRATCPRRRGQSRLGNGGTESRAGVLPHVRRDGADGSKAAVNRAQSAVLPKRRWLTD
jgi:hypothetical protein